MASYKTPGVYVEEISKFPPSVAQVETAIPAFIGYTQKAKEFANDDLLNIPRKVGSMIEFVQFYGGAPSVNITEVKLDSLNQVTSVNLADNYYLYEAMRMFFANGGGYCYIVSVGKYGDTIQNGDGISNGFIKGLNAVRKADEPTLLLAPDASRMAQSDMNSLHTAMLMQCADLQDRFTIMDVRKAEGLETYQNTISNFRDGVGMNNLKYGAAYSPWIIANLPREVKYKDFKGKIKQNGSPIALSGLINDPNAQALANRLDNLTNDQSFIASSISSLYVGSSSIQSKFEELLAPIKSIDGATSAATAKTKLGDLITFFGGVGDFMLGTVRVASPTLTDIGNPSYLVEFLRTKINTSLATSKTAIEKLAADANAATTGGLGMTATLPAAFTIPGAGTGLYAGADTIPTKVKNSIDELSAIWTDLSSILQMIVSTADSFASTIETSAIDAIPVLKTILRAISTNYITLPPSSTIAGIYARVDADRGVWKAPANVSISNAVGVSELIDNREQADLNVDTIAGKSINIIRPFTGKGMLVWGARTLAGNDNEWRYVSVRRFFIMVEESTRKATEQFVFEPNDANTWVRLRAMIENFLILQWRAGALAGAKPEQAFYVRIGLGQTMTADDILNGYMNVEIGMAVVRPAEFIVLKFSHKMQEA